MRKRRSDRNHIIYTIKNSITGEFYIGITVCRGRAYLKTIKIRLKQHVHRALNENREWNICRSIREYGPDAFTIKILDCVRGKSEAHRKEVELIKQYSPKLNTSSI